MIMGKNSMFFSIQPGFHGMNGSIVFLKALMQVDGV